jgi:FkbM family methyltransferase
MRWRPGRIARNTLHASSWSGIRIALQAASLVLMARVLGANGYGALAGSIALFMACGQFTGLGSGIALVRHVVRGGVLGSRFAATERAYLSSGLVLILVALPVSLGLLGTQVPRMALTLLAVTEILVAPALLPLVYRYQAEERLFLSSAIGTLAPIARLAAIASAAALGMRDISSFAQLYLAWLIPIVAVTLYFAWPRESVAPTSTTRQAVREGLPYAVSGVALTAGSELDKTVLLHLAGDAVTGPYAAAYRIASAATLPVNALILAAAPRLFRTPSAGNTRLAVTMLITVLGYAILAAAVLWQLAPFTPWLLGRGFDHAPPLLRALCLIIVTGSLRQYVTALLTTRDLQTSRNVIEIGGVCISLMALLLLVPAHGAYGAILAMAISDLCVTILGVVDNMRQNAKKDQARSGMIKNIIRRIFEYSGTGQWIYTKNVLGWTDDELLVRQLPPRLRIFCRYANAYNKYIGTKTILFAHGFYRLLGIESKKSKQACIEIHEMRIWLDLSDPGSLNAINEVRNGSDVSSEIKELCRDATTFIDIGANQGAMTAIASRVSPTTAKIIAIEPQRNLAACIEKTLEEHRPDGNWRVVQVAVGQCPSTARIVVPKENFGEAHLAETRSQSTQSPNTIPVITLDSLLGHLDLGEKVVVKMDIEVYEMSALIGAEEFIARHRPIIILEINPAAMSRYCYTVDDLGRLLCNFGYRLWRKCGMDHEYHSTADLPDDYCDIVLYAK